MVELQPSKLAMRVRFPSPAPSHLFPVWWTTARTIRPEYVARQADDDRFDIIGEKIPSTSRAWRHRRPTQVALLVVASLAFGVAPVSSATRPRQWSPPHSLGDSRVQVTYAISCRNATMCVVVDGLGQAMFRRSGRWTAPQVVAAGGSFDAVSCASSTFCLATASGNAVTYNGHTWSHAVSMGPSGYTYHVSCPSSSFCAAVGASGVAGQANVIATYDGHSWKHSSVGGAHSPLDRLLGVSCPSLSFCAAVNFDGHASTFNGQRWTTSRNSLVPSLVSVSCPSRTFCMAVSVSGEAATMHGTSWSRARAITGFSRDAAYTVSCATSSRCEVLGLSGRAESWHDGQWSSPVVVFAGGVSAGVQVSCPPSGPCVAVTDRAASASG